MDDDRMIGIQVDFGAMDVRSFCLEDATAAARELGMDLADMEPDVDYLSLYPYMASARGACCSVCSQRLVRSEVAA